MNRGRRSDDRQRNLTIASDPRCGPRRARPSPSGRSSATAAAQAKDMVQAPRFEVDPTFPKPLPNGWLLGQAIGVGVDAQDHIWIVHRQDSLGPNEAGADQNPPTASCCRRAPPDARVRSGGQPAPALGRSRPGLRLAERRITASRSITRATCGSAATSAATRTSLKFTQDGKFIAQFGKPRPRARARAATTRRTSAASRRSSSTRRRTRRTSPTATATSASPSSTPTPAR